MCTFIFRVQCHIISKDFYLYLKYIYTLINSAIFFMILLLIIFWTVKYLGRPRNKSLGPYVPQVELVISHMAYLTVSAWVEDPSTSGQYKSSPGSSRAWQAEEALLHRQLTWHFLRG